MKRTGRCIVVGLAICSWLAISNHCAFTALATKTESGQSTCPFHSKPAKPKGSPVGTQCCKILRAVVFATAKGWMRDDSKFSDVDLRLEQLIVVAASHSNLPLSLDTGPPGAHTFAELILQQSLFAHAPPVLA